MQQTETYKLNLIETSEPFSPAALNENTQKVETVLSAEAQTRAAADADLDSRITALKVHKVVVGHYQGTGDSKTQTFNLGFTPLAVIVISPNCHSPHTAMALQGFDAYDSGVYWRELTIISGGFKVNDPPHESCILNSLLDNYNYIAFA